MGPYRRCLCVWCQRASSVPVLRFMHNAVCVTASPFTAAYEAFVWILFSLHVWSPDDGRLDGFQAAARCSHAVLGIRIGVCGLVFSFLLGRWLGVQSLCPRASGTLVPCVSPPLIWGPQLCTPHQPFVLPFSLILAAPVVVMIAHCGLPLHFPGDSDDEHFLLCFFVICVPSLSV